MYELPDQRTANNSYCYPTQLAEKTFLKYKEIDLGIMKYFGAHVSAAGGVAKAPQNAVGIGANAFALFTKNQRQWNAPPLTQEEIDDFRSHCAAANFSNGQILPHNSYLTNLGNPETEKRLQSQNAFIDEMERCHLLGIDRLNFHPGSHLKLITVDQCLAYIAEGINRALDAVPDVCAVLENTAGQGTNLGYCFEQLAAIIEQVEDKSRVGVCIDTCHAHVAGYDLSTTEGYEAMMSAFESVIGLHYLKGMHLNDAMHGAGSKKDRHAPLGRGTIGLDAFRAIAQDPRTDDIPLILETPEPERWSEEITLLKSFRNE